jgi:hypothetical protein
MITKPEPSEYPAWAAAEIEGVHYDNLIVGLTDIVSQHMPLLRLFTPEELKRRYEPDKWTIPEIWQHILDAERVLAYRALRYSRQDTTVLSGFDSQQYVNLSLAAERNWEEMLDEYQTLRQSTIAMFKSFTQGMVLHTGTAGKSSMTVRALGYLILGHEIHHVKVIRERYLGIS